MRTNIMKKTVGTVFGIGLWTLTAIVLLILAMMLTGMRAKAGIIVLAGSGYNILPNNPTNFPALAQIGTFTFNSQSMYVSTLNGVTATNGMAMNGRLTFDGTNFFPMPQLLYNNQTTPLTNVLFTATNITFPVYASLNVSNSTSTTISNFQAYLQF